MSPKIKSVSGAKTQSAEPVPKGGRRSTTSGKKTDPAAQLTEENAASRSLSSAAEHDQEVATYTPRTNSVLEPETGKQAKSASPGRAHSRPEPETQSGVKSTKEAKPKKGTRSAARTGVVPQGDLERMEIEYDRAIRLYEGYYRQEPGWPDSPGYGWANAGAGEGYGWGARGQLEEPTSCEAQLFQLEQTAADFRLSLPYLRSLTGKDQTEYLAGWRAYLKDAERRSIELIAVLEKEFSSCGAADHEQYQTTEKQARR